MFILLSVFFSKLFVSMQTSNMLNYINFLSNYIRCFYWIINKIIYNN